MNNCRGLGPATMVPVAVGIVAAMTVTTSHVTAQVIDGPNGPVEFIGLQSWSAQELFDAIRELEPDRPFHACAAIMKQELRFADAAAFLYVSDKSSERYTVVVGVEDSTRVQYRPPGIETMQLPKAWQNLQASVAEHMNALDVAARRFHARGGLFNRTRRLARARDVDPETLDLVWDLIDRADGTEDLLLVHEVLAKDQSGLVRAIATLLLGNFIDDDTAWHALMGSLVDVDARVRTVARNLISGLISRKRDPVGWSAAQGPLLALFGGTNPFAFGETLDILNATGVEPEFGQLLARKRPHLLLAHVGAKHERSRRPAIAFLKAISGEDYGADPEAWAAWINS